MVTSRLHDCFDLNFYILYFVYNLVLCRYQFDRLPSPPGHPRAFAPKCVPSPRAFALQKMPWVGPIKDDVPGAGHLHQLAFKHENC